MTSNSDSSKITEVVKMGGGQAQEYGTSVGQRKSQIGIYGWRKRCLYCFLLILLVMIIINLALTIFLMKVMDFNMDGMGKMRIVKNGIKVDGESEFKGPIYLSGINSYDEPIMLNSARNITLTARNGDSITNKLVIAQKKVQSFCKHFEVKSVSGDSLFYVNEDEMSIGPKKFRISGSQGASFSQAVQTPLVKSEAGSELKFESPTRSMEIEAPGGVELSALGGDISALCATDLKLESKTGAIVLDAPTIELNELPVSEPKDDGKQYDEVYQVCTCQSGKLFLAEPDGDCRASPEVCP